MEREGHESDDWVPDEVDEAYRSPLPPDDRLWRHPSELVGTFVARPVRARDTWPVALLSGLAGALVTFGLVAATGVLDAGPEVEERVVREFVLRPATLAAPSSEGIVESIAEAVTPAIVRVEVEGEVPGLGSGIVFRDAGYVLTNAHVLAPGGRIEVVMADGEVLEGVRVGVDRETDVAVIKVDAGRPMATAVLGSAATLRVGQPVVAIGSPLGFDGDPSVSTGIVSALGREIEAENVEGRGDGDLLDLIQTDAAIAQGSSGGALLDANGAVIGITTALAISNEGAENIGFAVPIDIARMVADQLIETGGAVHSWIGIRGETLDAGEALEAGVRGGARLEAVLEDSPAEAAGLVEGDVVVGVDDREVTSMNALVVALRLRPPGDRVVLEVLRRGESRSVAVVLGERPSDLAG